MGNFLVNGAPVDFSQALPTGAEVKSELQLPTNRVVVATLSDGSQRQVLDSQKVPTNTTTLTALPPHIYG